MKVKKYVTVSIFQLTREKVKRLKQDSFDVC